MFRCALRRLVAVTACSTMVLAASQVAAHQTQHGDEQASEAGDAQNGEPDRSGFWISLGLGAGQFGNSEVSDHLGGATTMIELGGTVDEQFLVGAGLHAWARAEEDDTTLSASTLTLTGRFYPLADDDLYLKAGIGTGSVEYQFAGMSLSDSGPALNAGLGYEIPISSSWSVTPFSGGSAILLDESTSYYVQLGVGLSYH